MTVETEILCNQSLQIIKGDDQFHNLFNSSREIAEKIYELVGNFYNQKPLDFPVSLGEFDVLAISQLTNTFPKAIHAVTYKGFLLKIQTFIFAFTLIYLGL